MSTGLPKAARPSLGPPNSALPAIPMPKTRKSTGGIPTPGGEKTAPSTPRSGLRAPSVSGAPTPGGLLQPRAVSGINGAGKTLRKSVSINSFPQPPRSDGRISLPPSPLGAPGNRKLKTPTTPNYTFGNTTPSLLNGTGEGKSVARPGQRSSDGLTASPTQSRSSSAQDSYSTSATQYDDIGDSGSKAGLGISTSTSDSSSNRLSKLDGKGNVIVSVRVRPDAGGADSKTDGEWMVDGRKALVAYRGKEGGDYFYDNVFSTHDNNSKVYDHSAKRLVRRVMEGYHGTVFAYGMTGTGKTFSMQGTASSPGVIPLAITDIFSYIRETPSREFLLRVSYLEIYNERIHDLLSMPTGGGVGGNTAQEEIKLREDSKRGVYASPLKEEIVQSPTQLLRVIARGDQARRTASTQFNARSSRSHAVVQIVVESRERIPGNAATTNKRGGMPPGGVRVSTLSLIDLAGSEKAAESKERRTEGSHINKSLLTLGTVIAKLSEHKEGKSADKDNKHLPYRDSKLTRLLQGALSGGALVSILCTIQIGAAGSTAAANSHTTETINTLKFASRAKNNIVSHAKKAEEALGAGGDGGARVLLERYRMEILELRKELETQAKGGEGKDKEGSDDKAKEEERARDVEEELAREREAEHRHEEQMLEMQLARTALKERIDHLNRLILSSKSIGVNTGGSYSSLGIRSSVASVRSIATTNGGAGSGARSLLERTASTTSSSSTIGRRTSAARLSTAEGSPAEDDDSVGEYGDGMASLAAQNQSLQADLADKNRYIATLEKRLLQARRASSSRTSVGLGSAKGIMVGEDHSVSMVIRDKDAEIAELRARLDDKDRMLEALKRSARSRDHADRVDSRVDSRIESRLDLRIDSRTEFRSSQLLEPPSSPPVMALPPTPAPHMKSPLIPHGMLSANHSGPTSPVDNGNGKRQSAGSLRARTKSVDEMSRMLDEMIQDRVESGQLVRGTRGSVRVAPGGKEIVPDATLEPLRHTPSPTKEPQAVAVEA